MNTKKFFFILFCSAVCVTLGAIIPQAFAANNFQEVKCDPKADCYMSVERNGSIVYYIGSESFRFDPYSAEDRMVVSAYVDMTLSAQQQSRSFRMGYDSNHNIVYVVRPD